MSDKYDDAVAYLTEHPDKIEDAWNDGGYFENDTADEEPHSGAALFRFASKSGTGGICRSGLCYGCLTMIRDSPGIVAETEELTNAIRQDERIPTSWHDITVEHLPTFAEWQRRLDKELGRTL